jgi:hypothetical protein
MVFPQAPLTFRSGVGEKLQHHLVLRLKSPPLKSPRAVLPPGLRVRPSYCCLGGHLELHGLTLGSWAECTGQRDDPSGQGDDLC